MLRSHLSPDAGDTVDLTSSTPCGDVALRLTCTSMHGILQGLVRAVSLGARFSLMPALFGYVSTPLQSLLQK